MIITNNEEALRVKCEKVYPDEVGSLIETLEKELQRSNRIGNYGIGLAAPQIGIAKDIAIVRIGHNINFNLINATIKKKYDPKVFVNEGCLSFPGRLETTVRYQEIVVNTEHSAHNNFVATGLVAVVCQHEIDHLNSSLFFDHLAPKMQSKKIGPNDPCVCQQIDPISGKVKKFKKCCGK